MFQRRALIAGLFGMVAGPKALYAQSAPKRRTIGLLSWGPPMTASAAFVDELRVLGYVEGRNLTIDYRWIPSFERLGEEATALVHARVDVIVVVSTPAAVAAKAATTTIPVIMAASADPVGSGVVESLGRPGGNITGLALMNPDLTAKRVEILRQVSPNLRWLAAVHRGPSDFPVVAHWLKENEEVGRRFGIHIQDVPIAAEPNDWEKGLLAIPKRPGTAVTVLEDPTLIANSPRIAELLLKHRLPAVFPFREHVEGGGLLSYGVDLSHLFRRAAQYVDKVFRGAKPRELPIEQPSTFELLINLTTARALDVTIPRALLLRADKVIP